jgi:hypothetical protein
MHLRRGKLKDEPVWWGLCTDPRCPFRPRVAIVHAPDAPAALAKLRAYYPEYDPGTFSVERAE